MGSCVCCYGPPPPWLLRRPSQRNFPIVQILPPRHRRPLLSVVLTPSHTTSPNTLPPKCLPSLCRSSPPPPIPIIITTTIIPHPQKTTPPRHHPTAPWEKSSVDVAVCPRLKEHGLLRTSWDRLARCTLPLRAFVHLDAHRQNVTAKS